MIDILEQLALARCCGPNECQRAPDDQDGMCANAATMRAAADEIERLRALIRVEALMKGMSEAEIATLTEHEGTK